MFEKEDNMVKRTIIILFSCFALLNGNCGELYWQVGGNLAHDGDVTNTEVPHLDGTPLPMLIPKGNEDYGIRIKVVGPNVDPDTYLGIRFNDGSIFEGDYGVMISHDDGSGYFGTGITMSPISDDTANLFLAELIMFISDDEITVLGSSPMVSREDLEKFVSYDPIYTPPVFVWNPNDFYSTPEPSTSILCLIGASLLMLRRKRS